MNRQDAKNAKIEPGERLDQIARTVIGAVGCMGGARDYP